MKQILIVGGANGIGLSIAVELAKDKETECIHVVDKVKLSSLYINSKIKSYQFDLNSENYSFFDIFADIDTLIITAGFGKLALFKDIDEKHIIDSFSVNTISIIRLVKRFYHKMESQENFYCCIMGSIAGFMSSPFFAVYGATKAALKIFIESINIELEKAGTNNRILNVSPGSIAGTSFYKGETKLDSIKPLTLEIINNLKNKNDLYIPQYDCLYKDILERYHKDYHKEGIHSYEYKLKSKRN